MGASTFTAGRITDHGLFADVRGDTASTPVLFLHGGPGQGCYEFMAIQGDRLGAAVALVGIDQRGVDRSAPLAAASGLTIADVVDDCEAVRETLGIRRWAVLGHSFGGILALRYATSYPGSVSAVMFENPTWDVELTVRGALPRVAAVLAAAGHPAAAAAAREAAGDGRPVPELWTAYVAALSALGEGGEEYFVPSPAARELLAGIRSARPDNAADDDETGASTLNHHNAMVADDTFFQSLLPLLARLDRPALLITGGQDPTTSPEQRAAFRVSSPRNSVTDFGPAGHFVHAEEPEAYARLVGSFARGQAAG